MGNRIQAYIRENTLTAFYLLAFLLTWLFWIPQALYSHGLFPFPCDNTVIYILGGAGPLIAALLAARALYGKKDGEEVFRPFFRWRVNVIWYIAALFGGVIIMLSSMWMRGELGQGLERLTPSVGLIISFLTYLAAAIPEEIAWRGFALPRLQARYSALTSSLIVGVLWALWHLPLLLIKGSTMAAYSFLPYFIGILADSVIYVWLYNSTRGSVPIVTIFHAAANAVGPNAGAEQTIIVVLIALVIIVVCGPVHLSRQSEKIVISTKASIPG